jgi:hypothetical protein
MSAFFSGKKMAVPKAKLPYWKQWKNQPSPCAKTHPHSGGDRLSAMPGRHVAGSRMSVANLVSYLIGWGEQVLYWHQQEAAGEEVDFPAKGFKWNELGKLAQKYYADYQHITSWPTACHAGRESTATGITGEWL